LIDPDDRTVFVYEPDREIVIFDQPDDRLPMPEFAQGLVLTVGELFGWLVD
jgi:Uma2 family endonuclease